MGSLKIELHIYMIFNDFELLEKTINNNLKGFYYII